MVEAQCSCPVLVHINMQLHSLANTPKRPANLKQFYASVGAGLLCKAAFRCSFSLSLGQNRLHACHCLPQVRNHPPASTWTATVYTAWPWLLKSTPVPQSMTAGFQSLAACMQQSFLAAGNKAELQAKLEGARQTQGDLKAFIKQSDEEDWWSDVTDSEPLPPGPGNTPEEQLYKLFRLEQRRQQLPQGGDQQKLYQMVEEEQQRVNPLSPAGSAEQQAITAYAQSGLDFDALELQDVIARFQAGDTSKVTQSARTAPGRAQTSVGQEAGRLDDDEQAGQEEELDPAEPQDLSSYK